MADVLVMNEEEISRLNAKFLRLEDDVAEIRRMIERATFRSPDNGTVEAINIIDREKPR